MRFAGVNGDKNQNFHAMRKVTLNAGEHKENSTKNRLLVVDKERSPLLLISGLEMEHIFCYCGYINVIYGYIAVNITCAFLLVYAANRRENNFDRSRNVFED